MAKKAAGKKGDKPEAAAPAAKRKPRARAVHSDPDAPKGCEEQPLPQALEGGETATKSAAEWAYQRLILYIKNFEEQLDDQHEVAVGMADATGAIRIEGIGYFDPDIVTFYGQDQGGTRTQMIQHVTRLSVVLKAVPKNVEDAEPRRIGFRLAAEIDGG